MNPETKLMHQIMAQISMDGHFVLRTNAGNYLDMQGNTVRIGFPGLSDLVGCTREGRFFAVEVKTPGNKPRENQYRFLERVKELGGIAGWVTSVEEVRELLNG